MAQKNIVHDSDATSRHSNHHNRNVFVIGIAVIIGLVVMWVTLQPETKSTAISNGVETIAYSNALEMQNAQPWLDVQQKTICNDHLDETYALIQCQMDTSHKKLDAVSVVQYNNALEMQNAQPWLDVQQKIICNDHLDETYALIQCQMDTSHKKLDAASVVQYNNVLEMQNTQPWLDVQQKTICNDHLDETYALIQCQMDTSHKK